MKNALSAVKPYLLAYSVITLLNLSVFVLYGLTPEPFIYSAVIGLIIVLVCALVRYINLVKRSKLLAYTSDCVSAGTEIPPAETSAEAEFRHMALTLKNTLQAERENHLIETRDALDYYTRWVHQIKTPIAVMRLMLAEDSPSNQELNQELFKIEQYAEMALQYTRLSDGANDLIIREYPLDEMIREALRKYAPRFIAKKLSLEYAPIGRTIVTDRKWFSCILEQLISNAVKYTRTGGVSIRMDDNTLIVEDTGVGIANDDLPRIFEKGYTGANGRIGENSSGLGLYLARKAADLIGVTLKAESAPSQGTRFLVCINTFK